MVAIAVVDDAQSHRVDLIVGGDIDLIGRTRGDHQIGKGAVEANHQLAGQIKAAGGAQVEALALTPIAVLNLDGVMLELEIVQGKRIGRKQERRKEWFAGVAARVCLEDGITLGIR